MHTVGNDAAERTVLVLGGGGMRGMAHVGVHQALEEHGIRIDEVVATSVGATVGALICGGLENAEIASLVADLSKRDQFRINLLRLLVRGHRAGAVYRGGPFRASLRRALPVHDFRALAIPLVCNATSLEAGEPRYFGDGEDLDVPLPDACYASCALPGVFAPLRIDDDHYVDGGVTDAVPLGTAHRRNPGARILTVDLTPYTVRRKGAFDTSIRQILLRSYILTARALADRNREAYESANVCLVRPPLGGLGKFDYSRIAEVIERGYETTCAALEGSALFPEVGGPVVETDERPGEDEQASHLSDIA